MDSFLGNELKIYTIIDIIRKSDRKRKCGRKKCRRRDLNPHAIGATPSRWCVCQFRHFGLNNNSNLLNFKLIFN